MYYARFRDNIWAADLAKMESLSSKNENEVVKTLKDKKGKTVLNAFIETRRNLIVIQINYGLIKEENFTIKLCKHG